MIQTKDRLFPFRISKKTPVKSTDEVYNLAREKSTKLVMVKRFCSETPGNLFSLRLSSAHIDQTGELSSNAAVR